MYIVVFLLLVVAALCNSVMDSLKDKFKQSVFKHLNPIFWDASISWMNKWINGDKTQGRTFWKIFGIKIIKPAIITDGWHLFKFFMQLSLAVAFGILTPYFLGLPAFFTAWYIGFEPFYSKILVKK